MQVTERKRPFSDIVGWGFRPSQPLRRSRLPHHHLLGILIVCMLPLRLMAKTETGAGSAEPMKYAIKAGKIVTMTPGEEFATDKNVINNGVILVSNGKIEAIGPTSSVAIPQGYALIDASDRWVTPGIVEPHTHIGTEGGFNDMVTPINPELQISDCVNPEDMAIKGAVTGGVTTIHTMPGSGTNLAGFTVIVKLDTSCPEKMVLREIGAMKIAQAYNPERRGGDLGWTRMGMSWSLRQMLNQAKAYTQVWQEYERGQRKEKPEYKPELENMRKAFSGEIPTIVHTCEGWGIMQTIRMFHDENHLKVIETHAEYGGCIVGAEAAKRRDVSIDVGPALWVFLSWNPEMDNRFHGGAAEFYDAGVRNLSINTDSVGFGDQEELAFNASMSARMGLDDEVALKAITINSARALDIDDRVGSLEVGKDADIVIKRGSLLDCTAPADLVLINGKIVYRRDGVDLVVKTGQIRT